MAIPAWGRQELVKSLDLASIPELVVADTFWSEPYPVWRSGSGSTLDKTEEILNDTGILFVFSNMD